MSNDPTAGLSGIAALRAAKQKVTADEALIASEAERKRQIELFRNSRLAEGTQVFKHLRTRLFSLLEDVPRSSYEGKQYSSGAGTLHIGPVNAGPGAAVDKFDIFAWAPIAIECRPVNAQHYIWDATLIYASLLGKDRPRWYEIGFFKLYDRSNRDHPFGLKPGQPEFAQAVGMVMGSYNIAYGPVAIDDAAERAFLERWTTMFARAMVGALSRPTSMPLDIS